MSGYRCHEGSLKGQAQELVSVVATFKLNAGDELAKAAVRAPISQSFQGEERRNKLSTSVPSKSAYKATPKAKPQSSPAIAVASQPTAIATNDEWETF